MQDVFRSALSELVVRSFFSPLGVTFFKLDLLNQERREDNGEMVEHRREIKRHRHGGQW